MTSSDWQASVDSIFEYIFSFDGTGVAKTNKEFLRLIDCSVFEQLAEIGTHLQGEEFILFCQKIRQYNHRELQDDPEYGHMGLGYEGMKASFAPLLDKFSSCDERQVIIENTMSGQRSLSFKK